MRFVLVSQQYPPETAGGGIGTQTHAKAHGLARLGHDVVVISHSRDDRRREHRDGSVRVIRIPGFDERMRLNTTEAWWLSYSLEVAAVITQLHQQSPIDLVDFPEYGAEGFAWLLNRPAECPIATVIQLHGSLVMLTSTIGWPDADSELYRTGTFMEGACLRLADAVFSSSACSADWCARAYGIRREAIEVIHTGIDTDLFSPRNVPKEERPTVVFAGRITRSKGVATLVEAVLRLAPGVPGLQLRLIGRADREFHGWISHRASSSGIPGVVDMIGYVPREDLPDQLSRAHVFAAPSMYEGGPGFVYLEAMACGLPVIACSGSGAAEVVHPGSNGILVPPADVDALTAALEQLLDDDVRRTMGAQARLDVLESADSRVCLRRIEAFYRSVIAAVDPAKAGVAG
jgi:glycosyltransferase involved in cell wall biosynthesis